MKYKDQINPELRAIARKVPYNKAIIRLANIYQVISFQGFPRKLLIEQSRLKDIRG